MKVAAFVLASLSCALSFQSFPKQVTPLKSNIFMAPSQPPTTPTPDPNQPPKREPTPIPLPTVGLGKDQVLFFNLYIITQLIMFIRRSLM